jgi:hypothetical protein
MDKFDLYGALYLVCSRWHSGQSSRGYRILSRLQRLGYRPGLTIQRGRFESYEQMTAYGRLLRHKKEL